MKPFYVTTAIDYTNAPPHIGHAYEKILADVLARYHRLAGQKTFFLTGVDQHGQKVQQAAAKEGVPPQQFVQGLTEKFIALWQKLDLSYDDWAATTDPRHTQCVQEILQSLFNQDEIYKASYRGFYSVRQEQFLTDKERGPDGKFGSEWGEVVELEEENWYFRLEKHKAWLLDFIDRTPGLVVPEFRQRELRNAAEKLEGDLSISRPKTRLEWGIELPFDQNCVTYVWFDALVNYISFAGYKPGGSSEEFRQLWPALHVIGKDILIPAHGIYWLCMLHAMGFADADLPKFLVHGWVLMDGEKMSKSLGNIKDPNTFADTFGPEALRYYLMKDCAVSQDMNFTDERLIQAYNTDLANGLGNLLNRSLSMAQKFRTGVLKRSAELPAPFQGGGGLVDLPAIAAAATASVAAYQAAMENHQIHQAIAELSKIVTQGNALVDLAAPWKLAKDPEKAAELDAVLYTLAESLRLAAVLLAPVLPHAARDILAQLKIDDAPALAQAAWGGLADGHILSAPTPRFPRIESRE